MSGTTGMRAPVRRAQAGTTESPAVRWTLIGLALLFMFFFLVLPLAAVATEALRQSIHIPPSIRVEPGARVDVIVAADVDFSEVYALVRHDGG